VREEVAGPGEEVEALEEGEALVISLECARFGVNEIVA
jgi:hypothetical protein